VAFVAPTGGPGAAARGQPDQPGDAPAPPAISLPTGGGAIRGVGEKFAATPATGAGTVSVPVVLSPGRSGFGPSLSEDKCGGVSV
jgi:hypothetical protein